MNSIFLKGIQTPAPWHTKRCQSTRQPVDRICDLNGTHIADMIMPDTRNYTAEQYRNNRNLVVNAPRILAALLEATYTLHEMGIEPSEELKTLIRTCGGPAV